MRSIKSNEQLMLLKRQYLVERVMIDKKHLVRASTKTEAEKYHDEYDIVPCPRTGPINGYFDKTKAELQELDKNALIGGGTSILELIELFTERDFYFVLHANQVAGFVHYSDLNQPYVRIPLYGIMQVVETVSWNKISSLITDEDIRLVVTRGFRGLLRKKEKNEANNIGQGWIGILNLPEILKLARRHKKNQLTDEEIEDIRTVRNRLAHPHGNLIDKKQNIGQLYETYQSCLKVIKSA